MRRVVLKSPVLENCTPGSVRGAPGNRRPYLAKINRHPIFLSRYFSVSCSGLVAALPRCVLCG